MANKKDHSRNKLESGDIKYLCGGRTKVQIIGGTERTKVMCKILEAPTTSKFVINSYHNINRRCLYPRNDRKGGKSPMQVNGLEF